MTLDKSGTISVSDALFNVYPIIISFSSPRNVTVGLDSFSGCCMIIPISVDALGLLFARDMIGSLNTVFMVSMNVVVPSTVRLPEIIASSLTSNFFDFK